MGTRSITEFRDLWNGQGAEPVATIYRHWDGYPSCQGRLLFDYLSATPLINGVGPNQKKPFANGVGSLAAQFVVWMHEDGADPNLMHGVSDCGQEWHYVVTGNMKSGGWSESLPVRVQVFSGPVTAFGLGGEKCSQEEFSGSVAEFGEWLDSVSD